MATPRKANPQKGGRPTRWRREYDDQVYRLCLLGYSDEKIAAFYGVCEATVNNWKRDHPTFLERLRAGKAIADGHVVSALMQRALGYSHPEVDIKVVNGEIVKTHLTKHYPPDTPAIALWLTNRQPEMWKSKREVEVAPSAAAADLLQALVDKLPD